MLTLHLPAHLFWDLDISRMDDDINKRLIIERVFCMGDLDEIKILMDYYGEEIVKKEIINAGQLDKKTLNWASDFLKIPKNMFRCFSKIQSGRTYWNY